MKGTQVKSSFKYSFLIFSAYGTRIHIWLFKDEVRRKNTNHPHLLILLNLRDNSIKNLAIVP
jgi:hypothetical protein